MTKATPMKLKVTTRITNTNNSLTMNSMRVVRHHFSIGLVCQNCFAYSVLDLMALSWVTNFFPKPIGNEYHLKL